MCNNGQCIDTHATQLLFSLWAMDNCFVYNLGVNMHNSRHSLAKYNVDVSNMLEWDTIAVMVEKAHVYPHWPPPWECGDGGECATPLHLTAAPYATWENLCECVCVCWGGGGLCGGTSSSSLHGHGNSRENPHPPSPHPSKLLIGFHLCHPPT